jgi:hypothetical protein
VAGEEAPYSKPAIVQLREKYREALPELEFLSESDVNVKKLTELEAKLIGKDQVIESLVRNGEQLKEKMLKIEASKGLDISAEDEATLKAFLLDLKAGNVRIVPAKTKKP